MDDSKPTANWGRSEQSNLISCFKPLYIIEGRDSVADPCYIGGAGYGLVV